MSLLKHIQYRKSCGLTHFEEHVLAILAEDGEVKSSYLLAAGIRGNNAKNLRQSLIRKGFVQSRQHKNLVLVCLTEQGEAYIDRVKELYDVQNTGGL